MLFIKEEYYYMVWICWVFQLFFNLSFHFCSLQIYSVFLKSSGLWIKDPGCFFLTLQSVKILSVYFSFFFLFANLQPNSEEDERIQTILSLAFLSFAPIFFHPFWVLLQPTHNFQNPFIALTKHFSLWTLWL